MKIAYLLESGIDTRKRPFNGPSTHVRRVIEAWQAKGHTVRLINRLDGVIYACDDLETYRVVQVAGVDSGPWRWFERIVRRTQSLLRLPYAGFFEGWRFAAACRQELAGFDVLYERLGWMGTGGALAARQMGLPLVYEENGDPLDDLEAKGEAPTGLQLRLSLDLMRRAVHSARHVVASGLGWRKQFIRRWGIAPERITKVDNGTDLVQRLERGSLYHFQAAPAARKRIELIYLGGFYPWHGLPQLLQALAGALPSLPSLHLTLIGSGSGEQETRQQIAALGLESAVTLTGQQPPERYGPMLANADIGLSPYCGWKEYTGLKLLDYKAAGLAVIVSGEDGMPDIIQHGQSGWIVPPCDIPALQQAILHLAGDAALRRSMGQKARLEAEQIHTWQHTADEIEHILQEACR